MIDKMSENSLAKAYFWSCCRNNDLTNAKQIYSFYKTIIDIQNILNALEVAIYYNHTAIIQWLKTLD